MTVAQYAERRKAKACVYNRSCPRPLESDSLCDLHLKAVNDSGTRRRPGRYQTRLLAGMCTTDGCSDPPRPDCNTCEKCAKAAAVWMKTPKGKRAIRRAKKARKKRLLREGLCTNCGNEPLVTETLGDACREKLRARTNLPPGAPRKRVSRCSICRGDDHLAPTCKKRLVPEECPPRLEDFVYRRGTDPNQEAHEAA